MDIDRNGLDVLAEDECYRRLGDNGIGRVAVTVGALPAIFPVGYAVHDGAVYFRTAPGTKLAAATRGAIIAFEVDHIEPVSHSGWSVVVVGPTAVLDEEPTPSGGQLRVPRWLSSGPEHLVRLTPVMVTGRALGVKPSAVTSTDAYLPLDSCPDCGGDVFRFVSDGDLTNVVCTACFACWHPELGRVSRVSLETCPGCAVEPACRAANTRPTPDTELDRRQPCTAKSN